MKKTKSIIFIAVLFLGLFFLSSCYTKKKGIVPCPSHGYNNVHIENIDTVHTENV